MSELIAPISHEHEDEYPGLEGIENTPAADLLKFHGHLMNLRENPIGSDHEIAGKSALGFHLYDLEGGRLLSTLQDCRQERGRDASFPLDEDHPLKRKPGLLMATVHIPNYIRMWEDGVMDHPYEHMKGNASMWKEFYRRIDNDPRLFELYSCMLLTKDIQTNMSNRGNSIPFLAQALWGEDAEITAADLGASANFVWSRVACNGRCEVMDPYQAIDNTEYNGKTGIVMEASHTKLNVKQAVGVDRTDPLADEESLKWFLSCRHPKDVTQKKIDETKRKLQMYRNLPNVEFRLGNFLTPPLEQESFDMVTALTALYEVPYEQQQEMVNTVMPSLLTPRGIAVVADYLEVNEDGTLKFHNDHKDFTYRVAVRGQSTNDKWMEVLQYKNSACNEMRNGTHFTQFMELADQVRTT